MARSALRLLALVLAVAVFACVLLAPQILRVLAYGFSLDPQKFALTVFLSRVMAPYIFFIGLVALCMGILNSLGHFAAPALAPVVLNMAMIGSVLFLAPCLPGGVDPISALAFGVLLGGVLQLGLQVPFIVGRGVFHHSQAPFLHPGVVRSGRLMLPTVFGSAVYQINLLATTLFASLQVEGSLSCLYFADRLVQFPLGLFGVTAATAALPSLSRQVAADDLASLKVTLSHLLRLVWFVILPSMAGLMVLREPIVSLLFGRGAFDARSVRLTADVLLYYAVGLWAIAGARIVVQAFYALQDTRTPVKVGIASVAANLIFMGALSGPLGPKGLAVAVSMASALNLTLLVWALRKKIGRLGGATILLSVGRSGLCAALMAAGVWAVARRMMPAGPQAALDLLRGLTVSIAAGLGIYAAAALLLRSPELKILLGLAHKRGPGWRG